MTRRTEWIEAVLVALLVGAGLVSAAGPRLFYGALATAFAGISGVVLLAAGLTTIWAERTERLQGPRRAPALVLRGARDTALAALIMSSLLAWPLSRMWAGLPTGFTWSLETAGGAWRVGLQSFAAVLVLDAWLYLKHRLLHTRLLFPFHRAHHVYRDPTAFASFAVGPVESLLTFWPIVLMALPQAPHYAPVYFALVGGFVVLNLYLHCGVSLRPIEALLPRLYVNTSAFHNRHHANTDVNFGEALTLWDHLLGTRESR